MRCRMKMQKCSSCWILTHGHSGYEHSHTLSEVTLENTLLVTDLMLAWVLCFTSHKNRWTSLYPTNEWETTPVQSEISTTPPASVTKRREVLPFLLDLMCQWSIRVRPLDRPHSSLLKTFRWCYTCNFTLITSLIFGSTVIVSQCSREFSLFN